MGKYVMGYAKDKILNTPKNRFFANILLPTELNECMEWQGQDNGHGYGVMRYKGKPYYAHRFSFEYFYGEIPKGMHILHHCDNPKCVRPDHLFYGTHRTNIRNMHKKGRWKRKNPTLGEKSHLAKITLEQAIEVKLKLKNGLSVKNIANDLQISENIITKIKFGKTWKHINI